jgi:protein SCO1/2
MRRSQFLIAAASLLVAATPVLAHPDGEATADDDRIAPPPPTFQAGGVTVDEKLGALVPRDTTFVTSDGQNVSLGSVLAGDMPTILTFNYSDCPQLCSLQLNGLMTALPLVAVKAPPPPGGTGEGDIGFQIGAQFRIVTIDLEPHEPLAKLAAMKARYIDRLPEASRALARTGWTFLSANGDAAAIRRVADAVGFHYTYIKERAEWAHPAALIFLDTKGAVTRYVYGIQFETPDMRESIFKAGLAEPSTAVGFMNRCYHFDPDANSHARAGVLALRLGAVGCIVLLVAALGLARVVKKHRPSSQPLAGSRPGEVRP